MTMTKNLKKLVRALDRCDTSTDYVDVIRRIARTRDLDAIAILASLLDSPGPVGAAAVRGLISFGQFAESEMRRCLALSMDEDQIRNAHRVLAALGDRYSKRAVNAYCWADLEEEDEAAAKKKAAAGKRTKNDVKSV
jgi:HEAT repeat protein